VEVRSSGSLEKRWPEEQALAEALVEGRDG
jgi:hypothetical protein